MSKFRNHIDYVYGLLPEVNTPYGFIFYSFVCYIIVLFSGWMLNPTVDAILSEDAMQRKMKGKGQKARDENMRLRREQAAREKADNDKDKWKEFDKFINLN